MPSEPTQEQRSEVESRLKDTVESLLAHPQWKDPPNQNPTLYHVWDFVMRSLYMLSEYDNIKLGRRLQHPEQFQGGAGKGNAAAVRNFRDVCGRTMMLKLLVNDTRGITAMMTGNAGAPIDFGKNVKDAVEALDKACP
ncbi:hypothetical protein OIDMADRAFT_158705 [Oidiodendron maius Zn]|uniref:Uncharacterized protein n=1 Tax=Oidiodendron maius (strain Zn) TaxID=913774 RepID=A0A0C3CXS9_OIDMZ|nr:hypothetical protein OIDMADRAFT_158705 [Oidiodendron maius Zn]